MNRERNPANYFLIVYCAISIVALSAPLSVPVQAFKVIAAYVLNPLPFILARAEHRLAEMPASISHLISTDIENRQLREEAKQIPQLKDEVDALRRENERLKKELGIKPVNLHIHRWARVMERDTLNWYRYLVVDVGKKDGIEIDSPVLGLSSATLAAIGRITEVGPHWAKVLLLTDEVSAVAAYLPEKSSEGLVEGQGGGLLRMNYLPMQPPIAVGDVVRTSVTSATFPQDVLIGTITKIFQQDPFLTFQSAGITPSVDAGTLQEVLILTPQRKGGLAGGQTAP